MLGHDLRYRCVHGGAACFTATAVCRWRWASAPPASFNVWNGVRASLRGGAAGPSGMLTTRLSRQLDRRLERRTDDRVVGSYYSSAVASSVDRFSSLMAISNLITGRSSFQGGAGEGRGRLVSGGFFDCS